MNGDTPRQRRSGNMMAIITAIAVVAIFSSLTTVTRLMGPASIAIWAVTIAGIAAIANGRIGKTFAERFHEQPELPEAVVPPEIYAELDELRGRIAELEERQDFSERLLSKRPESGEHS